MMMQGKQNQGGIANGGAALDRQMIEFMTAKHHNSSVQQHPQHHSDIIRKQSSTPQPGPSTSATAFNKKKK